MFEIIYCLYLILSLILLIILERGSKRILLSKFVIVAVFPVVGWLMPPFWPKQWYRENEEDFDDYVRRQQEKKERETTNNVLFELEKEKELNVIPVDDALIISEHETRRKVMIDLLKQDSFHYIDVIQRAVENEDTETSHYAVSAIMETKRKLMIAMQDLSVQYEQHQDDLYIVESYAKVLKDYMQSGFLDERTLLKYRYLFISVLEQYIALSDQTEWAHQEKVNMELELREYIKAEKSGLLYLEKCPRSENAYLSLMKVYYYTRSYEHLQKTLERLKQAPIQLSNQALTAVRFWSKGA